MDTQKCRSCGAAILFVPTPKGKQMCLNAQPDPENGNVMLVDGIARVVKREEVLPGIELFLSHHADCPNAAHHRKVKS